MEFSGGDEIILVIIYRTPGKVDLLVIHAILFSSADSIEKK